MLTLLLLLQAIPTAPTNMVPVQLSEQGGSCVVALDTETFSLPQGKPHSAEQQALEVALTGLARSGKSAVIQPYDMNKVPYRCMGGFIYLAQAAGLKVGFVSEPPSQ